MTSYRWGSWAAVGVTTIGVVYIVVMAGAVFPGPGRERRLRCGFWLSGTLALLGTIGPLAGDMRLQRIGILGYAGVLPIAFFLLARLLWDSREQVLIAPVS